MYMDGNRKGGAEYIKSEEFKKLSSKLRFPKFLIVGA